jgi:hypothetical protein
MVETTYGEDLGYEFEVVSGYYYSSRFHRASKEKCRCYIA